jgi:hypothetical protein
VQATRQVVLGACATQVVHPDGPSAPAETLDCLGTTRIVAKLAAHHGSICVVEAVVADGAPGAVVLDFNATEAVITAGHETQCIVQFINGFS